MELIDDLELLTALATGDLDVYLRYSQGPEADSAGSLDHEADVPMPGLSVTPLRPEPWWPRRAADWVTRRVFSYAHLAEKRSERRPGLLTGRVVGLGPDHEPLIAGPLPLARPGPKLLTQAAEQYRERFTRGRDSAD
ncbi:hypothetical protein GCM10009639_24530 [Kitasatospora putterlickiae]|uniref:Uncharacterized protein n=1 Tax=Kitasatospora putterlickiae TaxID=221725 RepID=A0ABP4IKF8_9ACTN